MAAARSRSRQWRAIGVGAAGVAVAFAVAPSSHADAPGVPTTPTASGDTAGKAGPAATTAPAPALRANYGYQKYRVGVQIKSGAYVPEGTTTAGTELTITETGPGVEGHKQVSTCTTDASTALPGTTATFCLAPVEDVAAAARAHGTGTPTPPSAPNDQLFTANPGDKIVITQTSVNANLLTDPTAQVLTRCTVPDGNTPVCVAADGHSILSTDLIFTDPAPPPIAVNDHYATVQPNAVKIHVLTNDTTYGAPTTVTVDSGPSDGTLTLDSTEPGAQPAAAAAKPALGTSTTGNYVYQPKAGFTGTDHFTYTIATANGTSTAVVTIDVTAPAVTPPPSSPPPLANTGTHSGQLVEIGGALLLGGAGVLALGRRRRPARAAR